MKIVIAVAAAVLLPGSAREVAAEKPGGAPAALEGKLHGAWTGEGPCDGRLPLRADGTYERKLHGPGGNNCAGTWEVRWDALPPTLVLTCKTSDDPMYIRKEEVKLIQLDDQAPRVQVPVRPDDASALLAGEKVDTRPVADQKGWRGSRQDALPHYNHRRTKPL